MALGLRWSNCFRPACLLAWPYPCELSHDFTMAVLERNRMAKKRFRRGDHVSWNSEAGRVRRRIIRVITTRIRFKGYTVRASKVDPQYAIKSDKTDHIAMHRGAALRKLAG